MSVSFLIGNNLTEGLVVTSLYFHYLVGNHITERFVDLSVSFL